MQGDLRFRGHVGAPGAAFRHRGEAPDVGEFLRLGGLGGDLRQRLWFGSWSLDEFDDVPVRVSDIAAGDPVPGTTRVMQQHRVARYLARLRALDAFQRDAEVIHPQRDMGPAGTAAPGPDGSSRWADVPGQFDDSPVASVEVCDLKLD